MKLYLPLLVLLLSACSSAPYFRKAADPKDHGYTVKDSPEKEVFDVAVRLPSGTNLDDRYDYLVRAVGEECLARGFLFFDVGPIDTDEARGFCYPKNRKPSLGIHFDLMAFAAKEAVIRVLEVESGVATSLRPRDVIRKVGSKEIETLADYKSEIRRLGAEGNKTVTVSVERSGIALNLQAPLAEFREKIYSPDKLEALRKKLP